MKKPTAKRPFEIKLLPDLRPSEEYFKHFDELQNELDQEDEKTDLFEEEVRNRDKESSALNKDYEILLNLRNEKEAINQLISDAHKKSVKF